MTPYEPHRGPLGLSDDVKDLSPPALPHTQQARKAADEKVYDERHNEMMATCADLRAQLREAELKHAEAIKASERASRAALETAEREWRDRVLAAEASREELRLILRWTLFQAFRSAPTSEGGAP